MCIECICVQSWVCSPAYTCNPCTAGREIAKFLAAVQAAVYGGQQAVLTPAVWDTVLQRKLFEHREREAFRWEQAIMRQIATSLKSASLQAD